MPDPRIEAQLEFLVQADRLKLIERRTPLADASRLENSAEHSWHLVLMAMVMREHASANVDLLRTLEMVAVHDLVEIDAGDTFAYDVSAQAGKAAREMAAAERIFGLLPPDQRAHVHELWAEFEAQVTPEAQFATAVDRLQPLLQNACSGGGSWRTHGVKRDQVLQRMAPIERVMPMLWPLVVEIVDAFCAAGVIQTTP